MKQTLLSSVIILFISVTSCVDTGNEQSENINEESPDLTNNNINKAPVCEDIDAMELSSYEEPPDDRSGVFKHCQSNGLVLRYGKAEMGKKVGVWLVYHENGALWYECNNDSEGKQDGIAKEYSDAGDLICTETWQHGKLISEKGSGC